MIVLLPFPTHGAFYTKLFVRGLLAPVLQLHPTELRGISVKVPIQLALI